MAGLKVPGTVVARIIPFGIRIGKSVDHPMEKKRESKRIGGGKSRVRSRGLVSFLEGMNEKTISCTSTREI